MLKLISITIVAIAISTSALMAGKNITSLTTLHAEKTKAALIEVL